MTMLVARDVVPRWYAQAPPRVASQAWLEEMGTAFQYGVFGENGVHRGTAWSTYETPGKSIIRTDILVLEKVQLIGTIYIQSKTIFGDDNRIESIDLSIVSPMLTISLDGERHGPQFALQLKLGTFSTRQFVLDAEAAQTISDAIKPFSALRGLEEGQSWKIHVVDPISLVRGGRVKLNAVLVSVVGRETISFEGKPRDCFVVESSGARAWVEGSGRVLRQEVEVAGIGKIEIREQTFQIERMEAVKLRMNRARHSR
jgi:hypothetical protein